MFAMSAERNEKKEARRRINDSVISKFSFCRGKKRLLTTYFFKRRNSVGILIKIRPRFGPRINVSAIIFDCQYGKS